MFLREVGDNYNFCSPIYSDNSILAALTKLAKRATFEMPPRNFVVGTALLENPKFYSYYIIGKPSILFLFHNWNCVIPPKKIFWNLKISVHTFAPSSRRQKCHQPSRTSHGGKKMRTNSQNKC